MEDEVIVGDVIDRIRQKITVIKNKPKEPSKHKIVFFNDDQTTVQFVIAVLIEIYSKTREEAFELTESIHLSGPNGNQIVGEYYFEIAEQKVFETITLAANNGFPLRVEMEKG